MKSFKMRFTPEAARLVSKFHPESKKLIKQALDDLQQNPYTGKDLHEELRGLKSFRSKRYRIIYRVDEEENVLQVFHIGHRKDVYEQFRLLLNELQKPSL